MSDAHDDLPDELADLLGKLRGLADEFHTFAEDVNGNLSGAASDLREHGRWISEAAPLLKDLAAGFSDHKARLHEDAEILAELTKSVETLLEVMPHQPRHAPVCWVTLTADEAQETWPALGEWVDRVLVRRYYVDRDDLPDCWALHPGAVEELTWLWRSWLTAYLRTAGSVPAAEWHVRWRPSALTNVKRAVVREVIATRKTKCGPGKHLGSPLPGADADDPRPGAAGHPSPTRPRKPAEDPEYRPPGTELARRPYWWPHLLEAMRLDVADRREIERLKAEAEASTTDGLPTE